MKIYKWLLGALFAISIFIIILWASIEIPAFDKNFYLSQYNKNGTYEAINISTEDLYKVTTQIISYLKLETNTLNVDILMNGSLRPFYNETELYHMADVQDLFRIFSTLRNVCIIVALLSLVGVLYLKGSLKTIFRSLQVTFVILVSLLSLLFIVISTDFNKYFNMFHEIFFSNELWILDPATDLLINIVPLPFFMSISIYAATVFIASSLFVFIFSTLYLKKH